MSRSIYDYDGMGPMFRISEDMAVDSDGHNYRRMGNRMAVNMDTGEMHYTSSWDSDDSGYSSGRRNRSDDWGDSWSSRHDRFGDSDDSWGSRHSMFDDGDDSW